MVEEMKDGDVVYVVDYKQVVLDSAVGYMPAVSTDTINKISGHWDEAFMFLCRKGFVHKAVVFKTYDEALVALDELLLERITQIEEYLSQLKARHAGVKERLGK